MVSNELYHSSDNFAAPPPAPPTYQYSTIGNREYESIIGVFGHAQTNYAHLHRPSPPPLPSTLPNGRSATINGTPPTPNNLQHSPVPPPVLPPKGGVSTHVYGELEDPLSYTSSPPLSATVFEASTDELLPRNGQVLDHSNGQASATNGPFSRANGGPYRKFSSETQSNSSSMNESLYSPTTPSYPASSGLTDIPETGMSFLEPDDPTSFPTHEYEVIPPSRKTKKYESPVPDDSHMTSEGGHMIGSNPQTRASIKSANYETDPKLDLAQDSNTATSVSVGRINPYDSTNHLRISPPLRQNSDYSDLCRSASTTTPPSHTESNYSRLRQAEDSYGRLQTSGTIKVSDSDFFNGAREVVLSSRHSNTYDSDKEATPTHETTPTRSRGCSVPLSPPPVYSQQQYNQLTLPGFHGNQNRGAKTLVA